ncbi:hypothetical protein TSUD_414560 [Trifolium subterraneum]|uniref:Uncharacterized protein n=1 Tax=Trifolium subterraneum TaxID=3900 RepID=A0A2Z6PL37_TRISU|nr:hypothetical protein TSUD_414560 [Trifolium subterraneum]
MAEHTCMNEARFAEMEKRRKDQFNRIDALLETLLEKYNCPRSSSHGVVNSFNQTLPFQSKSVAESSRELNQRMAEISKEIKQSCTRITNLLQEEIVGTKYVLIHTLRSSEGTTWSGAKQSSEAQRGSECLKEFRSSEKFITSRMFRCLQEFRSYLLVMSHLEDEDVQKLNWERLSEANHSRPIRLQVIKGSSEAKEFPKSSEGLHQLQLSSLMICSKVKPLCKGRRGFTQRIFQDYSCPFYNGNFSNVSMSFSTHINMPKKELMTSDLH